MPIAAGAPILEGNGRGGDRSLNISAQNAPMGTTAGKRRQINPTVGRNAPRKRAGKNPDANAGWRRHR